MADLLALRSSRFLHSPIRSIGKLITDTAGSTAVEFGFVALPFFGLIGATIDVGMNFFRSAQLQIVTEIAARKVLTNKLDSQITYREFIDNYVCTWQATSSVQQGTLSKMFDCSKLILDIRSPSSWTSTDMDNDFNPALETDVIAPPAPGNIAVIRIVYPVKNFFGFLGNSPSRFGGISTSVLMGISAFRVEP
jgi:Flp pilus assembly protein TadG